MRINLAFLILAILLGSTADAGCGLFGKKKAFPRSQTFSSQPAGDTFFKVKVKKKFLAKGC